ncbi:retron Ec48 family effector membrane protein [Xanthomonas sp. NCPPB 2865]|uniref:retron Ec48 family effector membrane protein n=1 Tax=Xanthomonas TaxID=338 RepID=UPI0011AFDD25|nr:retron Ec48 family effector membrane protein [Xanthomonas arboricola]
MKLSRLLNKLKITTGVQNFVRNSGLSALLGLIALIFIVGCIIFTFSYFATARESAAFDKAICLSSACLGEFTKTFKNTLRLAGLFAACITWVLTIGGVLIALLNYLNSSASTALGNHVSHSKIFYEYLSWEIAKRPKINAQSIDIFGIYAMIFHRSRYGEMTISNDYIKNVKVVVECLRESNKSYVSSKGEGFRFSDHQSRFIAASGRLGITVAAMPRIDFFEVEGEILSLLKSINIVFCQVGSIDEFPERVYR